MNDNENGQKNSSEGGMYGEKEQKSAPKASKIGYIVIALVCAAVFFTVGWFARFYSIDPRMRSLMWVVDTIESKYYKEADLDKIYDDLYDAAMPDIFSSYYSAEEYAVLVKESEGSNSNFGIALTYEEDVMHIARVVGNSSADRAGIKVGMYLYRYGMSEAELQEGDYNAFSAFLRGKANQDIVFECGFDKESAQPYVVRSCEYLASYCDYEDGQNSYRFRGDGELALVRTGDGLEGIPADTAYIRLHEFDGNAAWEFGMLMDLMKYNGKSNLILDLRYNGGGYLTILQTLASYFVKNATEERPVVAKARYRSGREEKFKADGNYYGYYFNDNSKITVLADENSASASECLIGAMKDYGAIDYSDIYLRRTEDGTAHSYGKGVMQSAYVTLAGEALRLTSAEIFWPNGRSIHGTGVTDRDGAHAVDAPSLSGATDVFLEKVFQALSSSSSEIL